MEENKKLPAELEARVGRAVENFMQGYGCCQSVVAAFADLYGRHGKTRRCRLRRWSRANAYDVRCCVGHRRFGRTRLRSDRRQRPRRQVGMLQGSTGIARQIKSPEWFIDLCRDTRHQRQRKSRFKLCRFCANGRVLQEAPLCSKGRVCCQDICRISDDKVGSFYIYNMCRI